MKTLSENKKIEIVSNLTKFMDFDKAVRLKWERYKGLEAATENLYPRLNHIISFIIDRFKMGYTGSAAFDSLSRCGDIQFDETYENYLLIQCDLRPFCPIKSFPIPLFWATDEEIKTFVDNIKLTKAQEKELASYRKWMEDIDEREKHREEQKTKRKAVINKLTKQERELLDIRE